MKKLAGARETESAHTSAASSVPAVAQPANELVSGLHTPRSGSGKRGEQRDGSTANIRKLHPTLFSSLSSFLGRERERAEKGELLGASLPADRPLFPAPRALITASPAGLRCRRLCKCHRCLACLLVTCLSPSASLSGRAEAPPFGSSSSPYSSQFCSQSPSCLGREKSWFGFCLQTRCRLNSAIKSNAIPSPRQPLLPIAVPGTGPGNGAGNAAPCRTRPPPWATVRAHGGLKCKLSTPGLGNQSERVSSEQLHLHFL